jgi:hypothetical protein
MSRSRRQGEALAGATPDAHVARVSIATAASLAVLLAIAALIATAALSAPAFAAGIALDAPDNGEPPMIAYDPTTSTTYVAWTDPHAPAVDLCVLPPSAGACSGGEPVLLTDTKYSGYSEGNRPGLGGLVVLPGGEAVVIGTPAGTGSIAWASPAGGGAFLSGEHGLQNNGHFISPISLSYSIGNAVALSGSDVGLLDDADRFVSHFSDSPLTAESPAIPEAGNSNPGGQYPGKGYDTNGPDLAAEPAPPPAAAGTDIIVGVGENNNSGLKTPPGCLNDAATGYGVSAGLVDGTSRAAGTLNEEGLPEYQLLACSAEAPVLVSGGGAGIGELEEAGSGVDGAGGEFTIDYHQFSASATGGAFEAPVELSNVSGDVLDGVSAIDASEDSGTGVYSLWEDKQGSVIDYSANGGASWGEPTVAPAPYGGDNVIAGVGGGTALIAWDENHGTGDQVFVEAVNYQALLAANAKPTTPAPVTPGPILPTPNSTYTIKSIVVNSNGTVTITFVPTQSGLATLVVTVPTASIASTTAVAAKAKKCKHDQVKIKGKCLPINTVSGKTSAHGTAGVELKLKVNLSSKVKALLDKGKTVHVTATLTYTSSLGGKATVHTYHLTIKGVKKKK